MRRWNPTDDQPVYDDWADEKAKELAAGIMRLGSVKFIEKPEVLAKALEIISEGLPRLLIEEWWETALEVTKDNQEAWEAEAALDI